MRRHSQGRQPHLPSLFEAPASSSETQAVFTKTSNWLVEEESGSGRVHRNPGLQQTVSMTQPAGEETQIQ